MYRIFYLVLLLSAFSLSNGLVAEDHVMVMAPQKIEISMPYHVVQNGFKHPIKVVINFESDKKDVADSDQIKENVMKFLNLYPNDSDYIEVINKKLIKKLKEDYPSFNNLQTSIELTPDEKTPFVRKSTAEFKNERLIEGFEFDFTYKQPVTEKDLHLLVTLKYLDNLLPDEYPNYRQIGGSIHGFLDKQENVMDQWETVKPKLEVYLLEEFPMIDSIEIKTITN